MTAGPQTCPGLAATVCPPPHAPAGGGSRPRGVPASAGQHNGLTGRSMGHWPVPAVRPGHGRPEGELFTGFEEAGQRAGQGHHPESRRLDENTLPSASDPTPPPAHPPRDTQASCCVRLFPVAMSAALQCPVSGRRGGSHHCTPTLCARRFLPRPSPEKRGLQKGHVQLSLLSDLGRASSEWQLGLLHAA